MLFRYWDDPLRRAALDAIHRIYQSDHPPELSVYQEYDGNVTLYGSSSLADRAFVQEMALDNEVGIYDPQYFASAL